MIRGCKLGRMLCAAAALLGGMTTADAGLMVFDVIPAFAPKGPESPSWNGYVFSAVAGIQNHTNVGDRAVSPQAYERVTAPILPQELIYTDFNSWRGKASPTPLPLGFGGEFGNRIHFGLHIVAAEGTQFALGDLSWALDSDDTSDYFDQSGDFSTATYSATRVGIDYGADGVKGGGGANADTIINGGQPSSTLVNELIYVGVGDGFYADEPGPWTDQEQIDITQADILAGCFDPAGCLVNVEMTYSLANIGGASASAANKFSIVLVPEPTTALLGLLGLLATVARARRCR